MSNFSKLKIKLNAILIAEYENLVVYALYTNGKFSSTITLNLDDIDWEGYNQLGWLYNGIKWRTH